MINKRNARALAFVTAVFILGCSGNEGDKTPSAGAAGQVSAGVSADAVSVAKPTNSAKEEIGSGAGETMTQPGLPLPSESRLIIRDSLSIDRVRKVLDRRDFEKAIREFELEAARDSNALDLTSEYRKVIAAGLDADAKLTGFACGTSLCIGAIRTRANSSAYTRWADAFFADEATPNYVFTDMSIELGGGEVENRFFFSTDPGVSGTVIR